MAGSQIGLQYPVGVIRPIVRTTPGPGTPGGGGGAPPALEAALDRIQISLSALHERLADLESTKLSTATALGGESPLQLTKLAFLQLLVFLRLRSPIRSASKSGVSSVFIRLLTALMRVARRIMGDLAVVIVVVGIISRLRGGNGGGLLGDRKMWMRLLGGGRKQGELGN